MTQTLQKLICNTLKRPLIGDCKNGLLRGPIERLGGVRFDTQSHYETPEDCQPCRPCFPIKRPKRCVAPCPKKPCPPLRLDCPEPEPPKHCPFNPPPCRKKYDTCRKNPKVPPPPPCDDCDPCA